MNEGDNFVPLAVDEYEDLLSVKQMEELKLKLAQEKSNEIEDSVSDDVFEPPALEKVFFFFL